MEEEFMRDRGGPTRRNLLFFFLSVFGLALSVLTCQRSAQKGKDATVATRRQPIRCLNSLTTQDLVLNAIATNQEALFALNEFSLRDGFGPSGPTVLRNGLHHDRARRYFVYLVQCALPKGDVVDWEDPFTFEPVSFNGALGLCPDWATSPPTSDCLEIVSACLLARNNPEGKRVPLSLRGAHPDAALFQMLDRIHTDQHVPFTHDKLASFLPCSSSTDGESRNCGWNRQWVGRCGAGSVVFVSTDAPVFPDCSNPTAPRLGSSDGPSVLRACDGIFGCNADAGTLAAAGSGNCGTHPGPAITFPCPSSGSFSVMSGAYSSADDRTAIPEAAGAAVEYPALEQNIYSRKEGAFYGNLFDPFGLNRPFVRDVRVRPDGTIENENQNIPISVGAIFKNGWSCHDRRWTDGAAYLAHRLCAIPGLANCAANPTGTCYTDAGTSQCDSEDGVGLQDFEVCRDRDGGTWMNPITTFLNDPCHVLPNDAGMLCQDAGAGASVAIRRNVAAQSERYDSIAQGLLFLDDSDLVCELDETL